MVKAWLRASEVRVPVSQDEALRALEMIDERLVAIDASLKRTHDVAFMESVRGSWVSKRTEVEYVLAKLRAGDAPMSLKDEWRIHFVHTRACQTIAALDELTASGVTLTPRAARLRHQCGQNLPIGFWERWTTMQAEGAEQ